MSIAPRHLRSLACAALALLLAGCPSARHIRAAQDAFNDAARSENDLRAAAFTGSEPVEASAAAADYREAVALVDAELTEHAADLATEQLLGNALMLKALSLWRLTDLEESEADRAALDQTLIQLDRLATDQPTAFGTRDRVLIRALPGLRDHDHGLRAGTLDQASGYFTSAYVVLDRALTDDPPPPNHPVRVYVRLAQLAALRAYVAAVFRFAPADTPARQARLDAIFTCAQYSAAQLKPVARADQELTQTVQQMNTALGLPSLSGLPENPPSCSFTM